MKGYRFSTGAVFALLLLAHLARLAAEGFHLLKAPVFLGTSLLSFGLVVWAWRLACQPSPPDQGA